VIPAQAIALFLKPPVPGRVKTRLAKDIGAAAACTIYRNLADHSVQQADASGIPLVLFFDGVTHDELPEDWRVAAIRCLPQQGADLGQRMAAAFNALFAEGAQQVVLIGSDIPGIDRSYLQQAFQLLAHHDLVIGPALDGGYCLIGFNRQGFTPAVFSSISWSTEQVLDQSLARATNAGLSVGLLPVLRDIDTLEDLLAQEKQGGLPWKN
jgi:rSAM/selenodomain-associated transferase 1